MSLIVIAIVLPLVKRSAGFELLYEIQFAIISDTANVSVPQAKILKLHNFTSWSSQVHFVALSVLRVKTLQFWYHFASCFTNCEVWTINSDSDGNIIYINKHSNHPNIIRPILKSICARLWTVLCNQKELEKAVPIYK